MELTKELLCSSRDMYLIMDIQNGQCVYFEGSVPVIACARVNRLYCCSHYLIILLLLLLLLYCATGLRISHDKALSRVHRPINSIVRVSPSHRHSPTLKLVHLVFMSARVQLSSDIGLFLVERLWQYPVLTNVDSYPIIVLCRIFTYFYVHKQASSLNELVSWPRQTNELVQAFTHH